MQFEKAFWDGMVYPSIEDFIKRVNWLIEAANDNWSDSHKDKNPNQEVKKLATKVSWLTIEINANFNQF